MTKRETVFSKDLQNKKLTIVREFDAPLERVWEAWTKSEILDQWWAPKPYKTETKTMDFREGGFWLYFMKGPQGDGSWCIENYKTIEPKKRIVNSVGFCDEEGNPNTDFPLMHWLKEFAAIENRSKVNIEIAFDKEGDMEMIIQMGMQEGFTAALDNLDAYLSAK